MAADTTGDALVRALNKHGSLECTQPRNGETFHRSHVYVAPSGHDMMIGKRKIMITKGAHENRSRPGIDPLFRSAAVAHANDVIGVLLSGYLVDGTAGLAAIKACGGTCVVQDPADAACPDMPQNALNRVSVDHTLPLAEMGALLSTLVLRRRGKRHACPTNIAIEAKIAER